MKLPRDLINRILICSAFNKVLILRGIRKPTDTLNGKQLLALSALSDVSDHRSFKTKLNRAGISWYEYQGWINDPVFKAHHDRIAGEIFNKVQNDVDLQVASGALDGKLDFIKYYNELTGRHDPNKTAKADFQKFIDDVVKIITENVTDRETLMRMSQQLSLAVAKLG